MVSRIILILFTVLQLRHSSYTFRQVKVLSGVHLTEVQKAYVRSIGGSLTLGYYQDRRLPTATRQQEVNQGSGVFVLGRSNQRIVNQQQRQLVRARAGLGNGSQVTSFKRAFLNEETVMGTSYLRSKARMNSVVVYRDANQAPAFLQVHSFHLVTFGGQVILIALGRTVAKVDIQFVQGDALVGGALLDHLNSAFFQVHPIL